MNEAGGCQLPAGAIGCTPVRCCLGGNAAGALGACILAYTCVCNFKNAMKETMWRKAEREPEEAWPGKFPGVADRRSRCDLWGPENKE